MLNVITNETYFAPLDNFSQALPVEHRRYNPFHGESAK